MARLFGVPLVFAKKKKSINIDGDLYIAEIPPSTKKSVSQVIISKKFLKAEDSVLIVDDILAKLKAMDEETPDLGIRAFVWNIEKNY